MSITTKNVADSRRKLMDILEAPARRRYRLTMVCQRGHRCRSAVTFTSPKNLCTRHWNDWWSQPCSKETLPKDYRRLSLIETFRPGKPRYTPEVLH